jgi:serine/threonine protein kinase
VPIDDMIPDLSLNFVASEQLSVEDVVRGAIIGHGAYGDVYSGTLRSGRRVAIKELRTSHDVEEFASAVTSAGAAGGAANAGHAGNAGNAAAAAVAASAAAAAAGVGGAVGGGAAGAGGGGSENDAAVKTANQYRAFRREVWIMSLLTHVNVVRMLGFTCIPKHWLVMEFVEFGELYTLINGAELGAAEKRAAPTAADASNNSTLLPSEFKIDAAALRRGAATSAPAQATSERRALSTSMRLRIALDVARGMAFLHALKPPLLHRDLKSPNVFMASLDERASGPVAKVRVV